MEAGSPGEGWGYTRAEPWGGGKRQVDRPEERQREAPRMKPKPVALGLGGSRALPETEIGSGKLGEKKGKQHGQCGPWRV